MFGDGSDGPLEVLSGTTNLALDTKHQFTTVDIASGATLSTASTSGSVLYICATESIVIDGNIDLRNKIARGQNSFSVIIDNTQYSSPSTQNGGSGAGGAQSSNGGSQGSGFGGGGAGGATTPGGGQNRGGHGGAGSSSGGNGGAGRTTTGVGNTGGASSGGGGAALILSGSATSGRGGHSYGNNGLNGGGNGTNQATGGGGGSGGLAGHPGVHVVLRSPSVIINGSIYTSGSDGGNGGNGGTGTNNATAGSGGGGGGAGNGGSVYVTAYTDEFENNGTLDMDGGFAGMGGSGYQTGGIGGAGLHGSLHVSYLAPPVPPGNYAGPFSRVWDGDKWIYTSLKVRYGFKWTDRKPEVL